MNVGTFARTLTVMLALVASLGFVVSASAHPHEVTKGNGDKVVIANGQNHPGFTYDEETNLSVSCEGVLEPDNAGPAGYGLETAHHGPDAGKPGKGDGCFAAVGPPPPPDNNPAID